MTAPKRTDRTHAACRDALRAAGWYVYDSHHVGGGFMDLIAIKHGRVVFAEVKDGTLPPSRRCLTPDEQRVHAEFQLAGAEVYVMEDAADLSYFERPRSDPRSYDERGRLRGA